MHGTHCIKIKKTMFLIRDSPSI